MALPDLNWDSAAWAAGGFGALRLSEALAKVVVGWLRDRDAGRRAEKQAEETHDLLVSDKLREQIRELYQRLDVMDERLNLERERHSATIAEIALLKAENHQIRAREHQIRGYLTTLILTAQRYHRQLGYPDEDLPRLPAWVNEPISGPTTSASPTGEGA